MNDQRDDDEFLTVEEQSKRIKFSKQSLYNLISKGEFIMKKHYLKPRPKKILFIWKAVKEWLENPSGKIIPNPKVSRKYTTKAKSKRGDAAKAKSLINI